MKETYIFYYLSKNGDLQSTVVDSDGDNDFDSFDDFPSGLITEFKTISLQHCL